MWGSIGLSYTETGITADVMKGLEYKHFNALCFIKNIVGNDIAVEFLKRMSSQAIVTNNIMVKGIKLKTFMQSQGQVLRKPKPVVIVEYIDYTNDEDMILMRSKTDTELKYLKELVDYVLLEREIIDNEEEHF